MLKYLNFNMFKLETYGIMSKNYWVCTLSKLYLIISGSFKSTWSAIMKLLNYRSEPYVTDTWTYRPTLVVEILRFTILDLLSTTWGKDWNYICTLYDVLVWVVKLILAFGESLLLSGEVTL